MGILLEHIGMQMVVYIMTIIFLHQGEGKLLSSIKKEQVVITMVAVLLMKMGTRRAMKKGLKQEVPKIIDHTGSFVGNYYRDNCYVNRVRKFTDMASDDIF